MAENTYS